MTFRKSVQHLLHALLLCFCHAIGRIRHTAAMRYGSVRCAALVLRQLPFLQLVGVCEVAFENAPDPVWLVGVREVAIEETPTPAIVMGLHYPCQCCRLTGRSRRRHRTTCRCEWNLFCSAFKKLQAGSHAVSSALACASVSRSLR